MTKAAIAKLSEYLEALGLRFAKAGDNGWFHTLPRAFGVAAYGQRHRVWICDR